MGCCNNAPYYISAYDLWRKAGNEGTIEDFLDSLKGETGPQGEPGEKGDPGADGLPGKGLTILGFYTSAEDLEAAQTSPAAGDAYAVGTEAPYDIYVWDAVGEEWKNLGPIQGTKGDKGDKGDTGGTGPQGPKGDTGETGGSAFWPEILLVYTGAGEDRTPGYARSDERGNPIAPFTDLEWDDGTNPPAVRFRIEEYGAYIPYVAWVIQGETYRTYAASAIDVDTVKRYTCTIS